jgi:hypothetical protein
MVREGPVIPVISKAVVALELTAKLDEEESDPVRIREAVPLIVVVPV